MQQSSRMAPKRKAPTHSNLPAAKKSKKTTKQSTPIDRPRRTMMAIAAVASVVSAYACANNNACKTRAKEALEAMAQKSKEMSKRRKQLVPYAT